MCFFLNFCRKAVVVLYDKQYVAFVTMGCDRNMNDVISTGENA